MNGKKGFHKLLRRGVALSVVAWTVGLTCGCAYQKEYNTVLKQGTVEQKYDFAVRAYDKQDYKKSINLFEELLPFFRGKDAVEGLLYNLAYSYFYDKDYYMASHYFRALARQFPNGEYVERATYMAAYCKTLESPDYRLDQTATQEAIKQLQLYINYYPDSRRADEVARLIAEMRQKLATKAFHIAKMYYRRNLYNAAGICYRNFLKDYPESPDRAEAMYLMIRSHYLYAKNSVASMQPERYRRVLDDYELFMRVYADSQYREDVEKLVAESRKHI
ncbi:MAG: outer membrane protein assembly factor BamD [Bacteroidales bacterium]|nr:outer membrane protein assembly factor BamD [Bacteroidales bacterium]